MGGKGSNEASTQVDIPPWVMQSVAPLLQKSAQRMGTLQDQGFNVLQGNSPNGPAGRPEVPGLTLADFASVGSGGRVLGDPPVKNR